MVDPRAKGARGETDAIKVLKAYDGNNWQRIPMSGALNATHGLKGDLYVPNSLNIYCVEVKNYADDHLTSKILTDKKSQFQEWWEQTIREAAQVSRKPLLIYKFNRSKMFCAYKDMPNYTNYNWMFINVNGHEVYTSKLEDWLKYEQPRFV
jgi:hypothetical protein